MTEFLAMGGYAAYVWSAFAIAAILLVGLFLQSRRTVLRRAAELEALRATARPQRQTAARPLRPRRELGPAEPPVGEPG